MIRKITESDINKLVNKIVNENFVTGISSSESTELVDDVINRIKEHGTDYILKLNELNYEFPVSKYKRQERIKRTDFELPKGVKVKSSFFPED
jgi:polyhydroxyalkanoate synthesis regulator phasin